MSRRALWRASVIVQLVVLIVVLGAGAWWFATTRSQSTTAVAPDATSSAFVKSVRDSLATEQALGPARR
jgi:zona occludens toxin (predicted ATPase)